ncbi:acyltransferase [Aureococcus anophagefferens]|uniref:ETFB lysine methyltransferase n=1 Tax=Aureococcus anophagefferens TaxID=44056 RepID=A0ABR1G1M6_AURAN
MLLLLVPFAAPLARAPRKRTKIPPTTKSAEAPLALRHATTTLDGNCSIWVLEVADQGWWRASTAAENPYGAKLWPGALAAAARLRAVAAGRDVLELGCGNGFAALVAAASGARRVLATDVSPRALDLTRRAAAEQRLAVDVAAFDARGPEPLPAGFDLLVARAGKELVAADVLYDAPLALAVADRVVEARARGMDVVVGGSPDREGRDAFVAALSAKLPGAAFEPAYDVGHEDLKWKRKRVEVLHLLEGGGVSSG